jgi:pimeloyl-ACP methyl ester carboxylesterase
LDLLVAGPVMTRGGIRVTQTITAEAQWTTKPPDVRLFLWRKYVQRPGGRLAILFVHGSSIASQPTFDLQVPGRPWSSAMDYFATRGIDTWCVDMEGYGRSSKHRPITCDIANGADDLAAASAYILAHTGGRPLCVYGISAGALRVALFAARHPDRVARLALDAFVYTGRGSPTLEQRRKRLPEFEASLQERPVNVTNPTNQGGGAENLARSSAAAWSQLLGQPFEFEFHPISRGDQFRVLAVFNRMENRFAAYTKNALLMNAVFGTDIPDLC